jgi:hypothetical protein
MTILTERMWETGAPTQSLPHAASRTLPDWNIIQETSVTYYTVHRLYIVYRRIIGHTHRFFVRHVMNISCINVLLVSDPINICSMKSEDFAKVSIDKRL